MNENKKMSMIIFLLVAMIIALIVMGVICFSMYSKMNFIEGKDLSATRNDNLSNIDNNFINGENTVIDNPNKIPSNTIDNSENKEKTNMDNSDEDDVVYSINISNETLATLEAIKDNKIIKKEIDNDCAISTTGSQNIPLIGKVLVVYETGGEYLGSKIFKLIDGEIKELGVIGAAAWDVTYDINIENDKDIAITANNENGSLTNKFKTSNKIIDAKVVNILGCTVVLVDESTEKEHILQAYGLQTDYTTGKNIEICNLGTLKY